ncbi:MAG: SpoIVB peptidase, partial [Clostridiales bacterium]|nr:SpoIVB peptidase [Clostridiales bacterium]
MAMWNYMVRFYKNILWLYVLLTAALACQLLTSHIPDEIYVRQGEALNLSLSVPVTVEVQEEETQPEAIETLSMDDSAIYDNCQLNCYLFGIIPIKTISVQVVEAKSVYASGMVIGIYEQTDGVMVLKTASITGSDGKSVSPAENLVESGDYIYSANGTPVESKE